MALSHLGVRRGRHEDEVSSVPDRLPRGHKLAGLPEVTPVRVTGGARPFCF